MNEDRLSFRNIVTKQDIGEIKELVRETGVFSSEEADIAEELLLTGYDNGESGYYRFLIGELEGKITGYICYCAIAGTAGSYEIYWVAVRKESQGTGIGKSLMAELESIVIGSGGKRIFVATSSRAEYQKARNLYEVMGYEKAAVLEDYFDTGDHQVIFLKRLENVCSRCSRLQKTCCELESTFVAVTGGDISRISTFTGREDFYELKAVEEEYREEYTNPSDFSEDDAVYVKYMFDKEGRRNILKKAKNGVCCFLSSDGCVLPHDIRPIICRLYPYDWNDRYEVRLDAHYCPEELFSSNEDLIRKVGLPMDEAIRLVKQFYSEIMDPGPGLPG